MSYAIDHLTTGFVESLNEPLKASVHDKIDEVSKDQEALLDKFEALDGQLKGISGEFGQIALVYSLIPQYVSKLKRLQMEMQEIQDKSKDLKERAAEVQVMKTKTLAADAHLLAKPANTQKK